MQTALALAENLKLRLANDFQRKLLAATMQSVQEASNPLRLNNFSASFRELFRHVLVELAPDHQVTATSWFEPDEKNGGRVTRAQKVSYVVHGGLDPTYVEDELGIDVTAERIALLKTLDRLDKFTHVNEDSSIRARRTSSGTRRRPARRFSPSSTVQARPASSCAAGSRSESMTTWSARPSATPSSPSTKSRRIIASTTSTFIRLR